MARALTLPDQGPRNLNVAVQASRTTPLSKIKRYPTTPRTTSRHEKQRSSSIVNSDTADNIKEGDTSAHLQTMWARDVHSVSRSVTREGPISCKKCKLHTFHGTTSGF